MRYPIFAAVVVIGATKNLAGLSSVSAWTLSLTTRAYVGRARCSIHPLGAVSGADIEQPLSGETTDTGVLPLEEEEEEEMSPASAVASPSQLSRGKVNEIDFCIAPADVSLSRAYGSSIDGSSSSTNPSSSPSSSTTTTTTVGLSLTRALNNASNRAVRRILLARSWPSAEALNLSLRQVALAEKQREKRQKVTTTKDSMKCPVPRPVLNVLTRKRGQGEQQARPTPRGRTDEEYVADQLRSFRERYGTLPGYQYAEDYLDSILSLATAGVESSRVQAVLDGGVYDEAYKRVLSVLKSVGVVFEEEGDSGRKRIAKKLVDQDICLSTMDKIGMKHNTEQQHSTTVFVDCEIKDGMEKGGSNNKGGTVASSETKKKRGLRFWKARDEVEDDEPCEIKLTGEDLGGVLLSAEEPTMTRQLNVLSNIAERALLFGGDQELLVLAETLAADKAAFCDRWYPGTETPDQDQDETRPGVQYLNCLIQLLRKCYDRGVVTDLDPSTKLLPSYANAYERLVASAVELGSGYLKPEVAKNSDGLAILPKPRTAQEELGRFAVWESNFRQSRPDTSAYPSDLEGTWEVRDLIGGETIGKTTVELCEGGSVVVSAPLEGLRWRLDPGPTHLDTVTFQVLSSDGTILQYRGFIDRGARLEARFSGRPITIRGSVMFQMRAGSIDYFRDMLPINYRTGTTKFVMTKVQR